MSNTQLVLTLPESGEYAELSVSFKALDRLSKVGIDPIERMGRAAAGQDLLTLREAVWVLLIGATSAKDAPKLTEEAVGEVVVKAGAFHLGLAAKYLAAFCGAGPARKNESGTPE